MYGGEPIEFPPARILEYLLFETSLGIVPFLLVLALGVLSILYVLGHWYTIKFQMPVIFERKVKVYST